MLFLHYFFHFLSPPTAHCETNEEEKKEINIHYLHVLLIYSKTFHTNIQFNVIFFIYDTSLF